MKHEGDINCNWNTQKELEILGKGAGWTENQKTSGDHQNFSIKISQNTEESLGDLRSLAVSETLGKSHQLMLV